MTTSLAKEGTWVARATTLAASKLSMIKKGLIVHLLTA
jgi:hypothetical protein